MKNFNKPPTKYDNQNHLIEDVGMVTYFQSVTGYGRANCVQLFVVFMSRMINIYFMPSKEQGHVVQAYKDFMREEGAPACLHRDCSHEQNVQEIVDLNRDMRVKDSYSEPGCPNQNPVENLGVRIIKMAAEGLKIRTGAPDFLWPLMHKYLADVNNHCATPFLGWITPIQKRHGHIPDISPFLNFSFYEPVYFKLNDED